MFKLQQENWKERKQQQKFTTKIGNVRRFWRSDSMLMFFFLFVFFPSGFGDLEFSAFAYASALLSVICQSFYLTYIQKTGSEKGLSALTVLHTNSINCIPLLLIYTLCNRELQAALKFDGYYIVEFQVCLRIGITLLLLLQKLLKVKKEPLLAWLSIGTKSVKNANSNKKETENWKWKWICLANLSQPCK